MDVGPVISVIQLPIILPTRSDPPSMELIILSTIPSTIARQTESSGANIIDRIRSKIESEAGKLVGLLKDKKTPEGKVYTVLGRWQVRAGNHLFFGELRQTRQLR